MCFHHPCINYLLCLFYMYYVYICFFRHPYLEILYLFYNNYISSKDNHTSVGIYCTFCTMTTSIFSRQHYLGILYPLYNNCIPSTICSDTVDLLYYIRLFQDNHIQGYCTFCTMATFFSQTTRIHLRTDLQSSLTIGIMLCIPLTSIHSCFYNHFKYKTSAQHSNVPEQDYIGKSELS